MKQIEEIEKMSLEALETQAGDCSVKIPCPEKAFS